MHRIGEVATGRPLEGARVLLVEDEPRLRAVVSMMLAELGADVVEVADGESAVAEFEKSSPHVDLVLLDLRLRGLTGMEVYDRLLQLDPRVRVVLSSGIAPDPPSAEIIRRRGGAFIEKPYDLDRLAAVLGPVLRRQLDS